jgi:hypothetical protein
MDLSIIIVNWNVRDLLQRCLLSITHQQPIPLEAIVVDSASSDGSVEMVQREFPQVKIVAHTQNLGYACGNNLGMEHATGRYLMILNPDTEVVDDALTTMVRYLDAHPEVGAVGPQLRYPNGTLQPSRRRFPTPTTAFWESTLLHQWFPNNRYARRYHMADEPAEASAPSRDKEKPQAVDWLVGAALMMRRATWRQVGPLDEDFFMYFEELDWCRRCQAVGWQIHYLPTARIIHHEGKSSEQVVAARAARFQCSKIRYFTKYHGLFWGQTIRLFLLATYGVQLVEESLKWLTGHRRALRSQRISAYWQVLRSRLTIDTRQAG